MKYTNIVEGVFIARPNRFIAKVQIDGKEETAHVKNTGRCREILVPGTKVCLQYFDPAVYKRKTKYDLVSAYKGDMLINIDSQVPNAVAEEWLRSNEKITYIKREFVYGDSRMDFLLGSHNGKKILLEIKGCTLERDGIGFFPDAPTERGRKHLRELTGALKSGYAAVVGFVIQMDGISRVCPNTETDPGFGELLETAFEAGVDILFLECHVEQDSIEVIRVTTYNNRPVFWL